MSDNRIQIDRVTHDTASAERVTRIGVDDILADLNPEQREAVIRVGSPLLAVAGPGSGKTRVIAHRIAYRVQTNLLPDRILAITFTNRAAAEMKQRIAGLLGEDTLVRIGTFHWMCNALLRRHAHRIGYPRDFQLLSPSESRYAMRRVVASSGIASQVRAGALLSAISAVKNGASFPAVALQYAIPAEVLALVIEEYGKELARLRALDLDDLLAVSVQLLRRSEIVRHACQAAYDEILVDEYQDVNSVQHEILSLILPRSRSIVAVGDEDQSIYGWRQADARAMRRFAQDYPDATIIHLSETYRSTKFLLRAAEALISHNRDRIGKHLRTSNPAGERPFCYAVRDEVEEAEWMAAEIERLHAREALPYPEIAVLYRVNAQSRAIEDALVRNRIPYHIHAGFRFYDRPEILLAGAYFRLALDIRCDTAAQLLLRNVRGIGERRIAGLQLRADELGIPLVEMLEQKADGLGLPAAVRSSLNSLVLGIQRVRDVRERSLMHVIDAVIEEVERSLEERPELERVAAMENLLELRAMARELDGPKATLRSFVDRLSFSSEVTDTGDGVRLLSLHAAKGLEFAAVFMPGMEEGLLPHRRSLLAEAEIAEERRLCYVGMTRARRRLFLSYVQDRALGGNFLGGTPSRFIGELGNLNITLRASSRRQVKPRLNTVAPGDRVSHPRWHEGTVVQVHGQGRDTLVTIRFDGGKTERVQLCHAPLIRVAGEQGDVAAS